MIIELKKSALVKYYSKDIINNNVSVKGKQLIGNARFILKNVKVGHEIVDSKDKKIDNKSYQQLSEKDLVAPQSESKQIAHKVIDNFGKGPGLAILGTLIAGPPVIGYITFGLTGLVVGSTISAPFILVFVWAAFA